MVNAKDKLGAADRTQLAVMALLFGVVSAVSLAACSVITVVIVLRWPTLDP